MDRESRGLEAIFGTSSCGIFSQHPPNPNRARACVWKRPYRCCCRQLKPSSLIRVTCQMWTPVFFKRSHKTQMNRFGRETSYLDASCLYDKTPSRTLGPKIFFSSGWIWLDCFVPPSPTVSRAVQKCGHPAAGTACGPFLPCVEPKSTFEPHNRFVWHIIHPRY
jgi:hypothetical protein